MSEREVPVKDEAGNVIGSARAETTESGEVVAHITLEPGVFVQLTQHGSESYSIGEKK